MTPAEITELRERLVNACLKLELRERDVTTLERRNAQLENELKRVELHNVTLLKELIVLRRGRT